MRPEIDYPSSVDLSEKPCPDTVDISTQADFAPADRGFSAWSTLLSSCILGLFVWGLPNSAGALLAAYLEDPVYASQPHASSNLPLIGTLCTGIMYCSGVVIYPSLHYDLRLRRVYIWVGVGICFLSLLGPSFATNVTLLIALQGVAFAIGASLVYCPVISYMSEWWVERLGLANGIGVAGDNSGGVLFPIVMPALIKHFGIQNTVRIYAIALAIFLVPAAFFMKPRLPEAPADRSIAAPSPKPRDHSWMRDRRLWFFVAMNTFQGLAYFVPLTWLPTFATSLGLNESQASLTLTLSNAASILAGCSTGWLSDRYNIWALAFSTLLLTSVATFALWGIASFTYAGLLAYSIAYGLTAGCWSSMWSGFVRPISGDDLSLATTIFSILLFTRGLGNIVSTPVSTALQHAKIIPTYLRDSHELHLGLTVDDGQYALVIVYAGTCFAIAAAIAALGWSLDCRTSTRDIEAKSQA
ncbi:MFS general substrate transporter [Phanerochaete sordida]|uniref:MFS general substrate transporter n=1 Tax=Phanerochaete sordida TaxID=48140 RepID=A0A9P3GQC5_9APHY|nr:MFS general substrate transporter [Phanerochaete sordida]